MSYDCIQVARETLDAIEVHCGKKFAPGHFYVVMSRVGRIDQLCVINFDVKHLIPPPKVVLDEVFNYLLKDDVISNSRTFVRIQWSRTVRSHVSENVGKVVKRKDFTCPLW